MSRSEHVGNFWTLHFRHIHLNHIRDEVKVNKWEQVEFLVLFALSASCLSAGHAMFPDDVFGDTVCVLFCFPTWWKSL